MFRLADKKGDFIYQIEKDIFGDRMTIVEMDYWAAYNIIKSAEMYSIDWYGYALDEVIKQINDEYQKRKRKVESIGKGKKG